MEGISVTVDPNNAPIQATTNSSGFYTLQKQPGAYPIRVSGTLINASPNVQSPSIDLSQSRVLDITFPFKKVTAHAQDQNGNPIENVSFDVGSLTDFTFSAGGVQFTGKSNIISSKGNKTSSNGNVLLLLFTGTYNFTAIPPANSIFNSVTINLDVTADQTEVISLQFIHEPPVTVADLETENQDGTYSDPTTVTLSATAASGFTIANTYYTVDGGTQQTYTVPFIVSGEGEHTITYWSIDNVGVPESPKSTTFTIHSNEPPVIDELSNATLDEGDTYSANGSFTDPDSTSWTATVDYGDGTVEPLTLSGTNFSLNHVYQDNGIYTVQVFVTDDEGDIGGTSATITVNNVAPSVSAINVSSSLVQVGTQITATANFTDPGVLDTHEATWNWGDGNTPGTINNGTVSDTHTYTQAGVYEITLTVEDNDGGSGSSTFQYLVVYDPSAGFLTGAGRFDSPNPSGNVIFGVSAKYTGTGTPTGEARINFQAGDITLDSTSYQWLVVTGAKATLKGDATVNGTAGYTFIISGIDGSQTGGDNLIRVKITDSSNNTIYDTQPGAADTAAPTTPLSNGTIKVH
jgi:hypothetical protein